MTYREVRDRITNREFNAWYEEDSLRWPALYLAAYTHRWLENLAWGDWA